jgi:hypothetical protein
LNGKQGKVIAALVAALIVTVILCTAVMIYVQGRHASDRTAYMVTANGAGVIVTPTAPPRPTWGSGPDGNRFELELRDYSFGNDGIGNTWLTGTVRNNSGRPVTHIAARFLLTAPDSSTRAIVADNADDQRHPVSGDLSPGANLHVVYWLPSDRAKECKLVGIDGEFAGPR